MNGLLADPVGYDGDAQWPLLFAPRFVDVAPLDRFAAIGVVDEPMAQGAETLLLFLRPNKKGTQIKRGQATFPEEKVACPLFLSLFSAVPFFRISALGDNPNGMHDAGDIPQQRQKDVQPERSPKPHLQKNTEGWQKNRDQNPNKIHNFSSLFPESPHIFGKNHKRSDTTGRIQ